MAGGERSSGSAANSSRKRKAAATDDGGARADVITLLRSAVEFKNRTGAPPTPTTMASFFRNVKDKLRSPIPEMKVYNKFRTLRHSLNQAAASGRTGGDDDLVLKLSAELWPLPDKEKKDKKAKKEDVKVKKEQKKPGKKEDDGKKKNVDHVANKEDESDTDMEGGEEDEEDHDAKKKMEMDDDGKKKSHTKVQDQEGNDTNTDEDGDDDDHEDEKEEKKLEHNYEDGSGEDEENDEEEDADEKEKPEMQYMVNGGKQQVALGDEAQNVKKGNNSKVKELKEGKERGASSDTYPYVSNVAEEYWKNHGLWNVSLKEAWKSIDCSKARVLEEKFKKYYHEELRLQAEWGKLNREILESLIQKHKSM